MFNKNSFWKILIIIGGILLATAAVAAQSVQSQLAQKIMLENHLRSQAEKALAQALGDKERFIVSVVAELNLTPSQRSEQVWEPSSARGKDIASLKNALSQNNGDIQQPPIQSFDPVLPGFPVIKQGEEQAQQSPVDIQNSNGDTPAKEIIPQESEESASNLVSYSIERMTGSIPEIRNIIVTVMLEDGVSRAIIDMVRPVVEIATGIDYARGDNLDVVTASFLAGEALAQLTVEASQGAIEDTSAAAIERNLLNRMNEIEQKQEDLDSTEAFMANLPLWVGGGFLAFLLLMIVGAFLIKMLRRPVDPLAPEDDMAIEPQTFYGTPAEVAAAEADARAAQQALSTRQRSQALEKDMHRAELKNTRQAVITLSVGRPDTATKILNDWITSEGEGSGEGV